jgi:hypothetical protein
MDIARIEIIVTAEKGIAGVITLDPITVDAAGTKRRALPLSPKLDEEKASPSPGTDGMFCPSCDCPNWSCPSSNSPNSSTWRETDVPTRRAGSETLTATTLPAGNPLTCHAFTCVQPALPLLVWLVD